MSIFDKNLFYLLSWRTTDLRRTRISIGGTRRKRYSTRNSPCNDAGSKEQLSASCLKYTTIWRGFDSRNFSSYSDNESFRIVQTWEVFLKLSSKVVASNAEAIKRKKKISNVTKSKHIIYRNSIKLLYLLHYLTCSRIIDIYLKKKKKEKKQKSLINILFLLKRIISLWKKKSRFNRFRA